MQVMYLGTAPRTKETLPDFLKWRRVTRHPLVFRGLTGSQRTLGFWGVTKMVRSLALNFTYHIRIPTHTKKCQNVGSEIRNEATVRVEK